MSGIFSHRALYTAFGTPRTLDEIERAVYVLPVWTLRHAGKKQTLEITKSPATFPTYVAMLKAGWIDVDENEFDAIGNEDKE